MNNKFEVVPATNKSGFRNTFLPEDVPFQLRNTKVEKVDNKFIATAYNRFTRVKYWQEIHYRLTFNKMLGLL